MANCDLVHFELVRYVQLIFQFALFCFEHLPFKYGHIFQDDGTDLTDPLPESQQKMLILKEVINVFEALMGYKIATLSSGNENQCGIINSLFQGYTRFLHFGKVSECLP